jgi:integrase
MGAQKKPKMAVNIDDKEGKLRLRLPRSVAGGKQVYIYSGLDATEINVKRVSGVANWIEEDILTEQLDPTLAKYKEKLASFKNRHLVVVEPRKPVEPRFNLLTLWDRYTEYMKPQLAETTYIKDYSRKYRNHIKSLPSHSLDDSVAIRDYLLANLTTNAVKRVLTYLSACVGWAVKSGLVKDNPFMQMSADIKLPKSDDDAIDPFSKSEMDAIIGAFEANKPHYAPFIKFLFWTGCRTGEAIALQWKHIAPDYSVITFSDSYDGATKVRKCTKTGKSRRFPCNNRLKELLRELRKANQSPDDSVFTSPNGGMISNTRFSQQVWQGGKQGTKTYTGIMPALVASGAVERYRCLYNTRHTFITLMLGEGLTVSTVAKLVGNSPAIILKHYAGNVAPLELPEL